MRLEISPVAPPKSKMILPKISRGTVDPFSERARYVIFLAVYLLFIGFKPLDNHNSRQTKCKQSHFLH